MVIFLSFFQCLLVGFPRFLYLYIYVYLYQYGLMVILLNKFITIIYFNAHIKDPVGALSGWFLCLFDVWLSSLVFGIRSSSLSCIFPGPVLESTISWRSPCFLRWRMTFRNEDLGARCDHCNWGVTASGACPRRNWGACVCFYDCIYFQVHPRMSLPPSETTSSERCSDTHSPPEVTQ